MTTPKHQPDSSLFAVDGHDAMDVDVYEQAGAVPLVAQPQPLPAAHALSDDEPPGGGDGGGAEPMDWTSSSLAAAPPGGSTPSQSTSHRTPSVQSAMGSSPHPPQGGEPEEQERESSKPPREAYRDALSLELSRGLSLNDMVEATAERARQAESLHRIKQTYQRWNDKLQRQKGTLAGAPALPLPELKFWQQLPPEARNSFCGFDYYRSALDEIRQRITYFLGGFSLAFIDVPAKFHKFVWDPSRGTFISSFSIVLLDYDPLGRPKVGAVLPGHHGGPESEPSTPGDAESGVRPETHALLAHPQPETPSGEQGVNDRWIEVLQADGLEPVRIKRQDTAHPDYPGSLHYIGRVLWHAVKPEFPAQERNPAVHLVSSIDANQILDGSLKPDSPNLPNAMAELTSHTAEHSAKRAAAAAEAEAEADSESTPHDAAAQAGSKRKRPHPASDPAPASASEPSSRYGARDAQRAGEDRFGEHTLDTLIEKRAKLNANHSKCKQNVAKLTKKREHAKTLEAKQEVQRRIDNTIQTQEKIAAKLESLRPEIRRHQERSRRRKSKEKVQSRLAFSPANASRDSVSHTGREDRAQDEERTDPEPAHDVVETEEPPSPPNALKDELTDQLSAGPPRIGPELGNALRAHLEQADRVAAGQESPPSPENPTALASALTWFRHKALSLLQQPEHCKINNPGPLCALLSACDDSRLASPGAIVSRQSIQLAELPVQFGDQDMQALNGGHGLVSCLNGKALDPIELGEEDMIVLTLQPSGQGAPERFTFKAKRNRAFDMLQFVLCPTHRIFNHDAPLTESTTGSATPSWTKSRPQVEGVLYASFRFFNRCIKLS